MGRRGLRDYLSRFRISRVEDRMIEDVLPTPVIIVGQVQDADTVVRQAVNAAGEITEASAAQIYAAAQNVRFGGVNSTPLFWTAAGGVSSAAVNVPWIPVVPVQAIEAGGAVPNAEIAPLDATRQIDVVLDMLIYSAAGGVCVVAMEEDHAGAPATCIPDWGAVTFTVGAGVTYFPKFVRCMTTNINVDIGLDGSASDLPANDDSFAFWGYYRYV